MHYVDMQINVSIISCDYFSQTLLHFWDTLYVHSYCITYYVAIWKFIRKIACEYAVLYAAPTMLQTDRKQNMTKLCWYT